MLRHARRVRQTRREVNYRATSGCCGTTVTTSAGIRARRGHVAGCKRRKREYGWNLRLRAKKHQNAQNNSEQEKCRSTKASHSYFPLQPRCLLGGAQRCVASSGNGEGFGACSQPKSSECAAHFHAV